MPKKLQISFLVAGGLLLVSQLFRPSQSANMTSVSVTLSNPRLSFVGRIAAAVTGSNQVQIKTGGAGISSLDTNQLQQDDTVSIGTGGALHPYTVFQTSSSSGALFTTTTTLASGDTDVDDFVIASQSATLSVGFVTANAVTDGVIQVLVPAASANAADGIPDPGYYDFGTVTPTVTCPTDVASKYDFIATGEATASSVTINGSPYHSYICRYSGPGSVSQNFATPMTINNVINPSAVSGHTAGTADTNRIIVRNLDGSGNVVDSTTVSVGVIEAVKVSAEVPPQIVFTIAGIAGGTADACGTGVPADAAFSTTSTKVPFGELALSTFRIGAQRLTVSTNAAGGYVVTTKENDQLGKDGATCTGTAPTSPTCIIDAIGDVGGASSMTESAPAKWATTAAKGFAYTLVSKAGSPILPFSASTASGYCTGNSAYDCYRQFADAQEGGETPQTIFSNNQVADSEGVNVCYKINVGPLTAAGSYENYITYTATATF